MATSKVKIANRALQKLGAKRIESFDQDHKNARAMKAAYDLTRDAEIRRYAWSFAIKRESIAADGDDPTWGDWNRYSLPNDFIRLLRDDESGIRVDWRIEGLYILSRDAAPLEIRYLARIDDPNYYDSLFIEAFAGALAKQTCKELTGSTSALGEVIEQYKVDIAEAKRVGAIEKEADDAPEDEWLTARYR